MMQKEFKYSKAVIGIMLQESEEESPFFNQFSDLELEKIVVNPALLMDELKDG